MLAVYKSKKFINVDFGFHQQVENFLPQLSLAGHYSARHRMMIDAEPFVKNRFQSMRQRSMADIMEKRSSNKQNSTALRELSAARIKVCKVGHGNRMLETIVSASVRRSTRSVSNVVDCAEEADPG